MITPRNGNCQMRLKFDDKEDFKNMDIDFEISEGMYFEEEGDFVKFKGLVISRRYVDWTSKKRRCYIYHCRL